MGFATISTLLLSALCLLSEARIQNWDAKDHEVLAKTIYAEARGESLEGQHAVGHVVMTRAKANKPYWGGNTIAGVCLQPNQFECWNGKSDIDIPDNERSVYDRIYKWVPDLLDGKIRDPTNGADYYNNPKIESGEREPAWVQKADKTMDIGNHRFYHIGY